MKMLRQHKKDQAEQRLRMGGAWIGDNYIFTKWDGSQMGVCTPNAALKKIIARYNSDPARDPLPAVCLHATRHTSATLSIAAGMDVKSVSARLGHADASTTLDIYAHALKTMDEKIANALEEMLVDKKAGKNRQKNYVFLKLLTKVDQIAKPPLDGAVSD
jgi:integrase